MLKYDFNQWLQPKKHSGKCYTALKQFDGVYYNIISTDSRGYLYLSSPINNYNELVHQQECRQVPPSTDFMIDRGILKESTNNYRCSSVLSSVFIIDTCLKYVMSYSNIHCTYDLKLRTRNYYIENTKRFSVRVKDKKVCITTELGCYYAIYNTARDNGYSISIDVKGFECVITLPEGETDALARFKLIAIMDSLFYYYIDL